MTVAVVAYVLLSLSLSLSLCAANSDELAASSATCSLPDCIADDGAHALELLQKSMEVVEDASHIKDPPQLSTEKLKHVFDSIATGNMWHSSETVSGAGSELDETAFVRECIGQWIQKYNVKSFVDAPCGDANWQGAIPGLDNIHYKGYDIADEPLKIAREKNANHTLMSFQFMDLTSEVPQMADIIMTRDVIQHLPLQKGTRLLLNAKASGARFLAVTTFSDGDNINITAGNFYKNNVHASPFSLPIALESCQNYVGTTVGGAALPTDRLELIDLSTWSP